MAWRLHGITLISFIIIWMPQRVTGIEQYCRANVLTEAGDVKIAAILALHNSEGGECVGISKNELQIAAAMRWAVNKLNGNGDEKKSFIPGIKLGYDIYDDCGLEILSSKHLNDIQSVGEARQCMNTPVNSSTVPLVGIIGTSISQTTTSIARLLNHTNIPIVGIAATLSELSDKMMYPNFVRSVPSNKLQTRVMLEMVKQLDWSYIIGIHTDDNYGREGFQAFRDLLQHTDVCISRVLTVSRQDVDRKDVAADFIRSVLSEINSTAGDQIGVVYFGQDAEAIEIFDMVFERGSRWHNPQRFNNVQWIMSDGVETSSNVAAAHKPFQSLLLSISPANNALPEIQEDFIRLLSMNDSLGLSVQWRGIVRDYLQSFYPCGGTLSCNEASLRLGYRQYSYISSALDAIYIFASGLKAAHSTLCPNTIGMCDQLQKALSENILKEYKVSMIRYRTLGEVYVPGNFYSNERYLEVDGNGDYIVRNESLYDINIAPYGKEEFNKVGEYSADGSLNMSMLGASWNVPTQSRCKSVCETCLHKDQLLKIFIPGDVLVLGMFPVHGPGELYSCGDYRSQGSSFVSLLSFLSTLSDFKRNTGVNVGGVVLDDCYNPLRAANLLNMIFSGEDRLVDIESGQVIDLTKVIAVVGAQSSSLALSVLPVLTHLKIPLVSYSATSLDLDDRINYPYFLRTVPSDTTQAAAMRDIVSRFNITHVSVVNVDNNYGRKGVQAFREAAESRGICVDTSIEMTEKDSKATLLQAISILERSQTKYVVFFGLNTIAINLFDVMGLSESEFIFIASETWGRNIKVIQGDRGKRSRGSLTLSVQTSAVVENRFEDYLSDLREDNHNSNPWFGSFWQSTFQCNLAKSFNNIYDRSCGPDLRLSEDQIQQFAGDERVVQTMNAVYAALQGYVDSTPDSCDSRFIGNCDKPEVEKYVERMRSVTARTATGSRFTVFNSEGDGNIGFVVNNVQRLDDGTYAYMEVGSYDARTLSLNTKNIKFYSELGNVISAPEASCKYIATCNVCKLKQTVSNGNGSSTESNGGSKSSQPEDNGGALVPVVAVLGALVFILIVFLGVVIFLVLRHNAVLKKETSNSDQRSSCYQVTMETMRRPSQATLSLSRGSTLNFSHVSPDNSDSTGTSSTSPGGTESDASGNAQRLPVTYMSFESGSPEIINVISGHGQPQYTFSRTPIDQADYLHVVQEPVLTPRPIQIVNRPSPGVINQPSSSSMHHLHPIPERSEHHDLPQENIEYTEPILRNPAVTVRSSSGQRPNTNSLVDAASGVPSGTLRKVSQNDPLSMPNNSINRHHRYPPSEGTSLHVPQESRTMHDGLTEKAQAQLNHPHQYGGPSHVDRTTSPSSHYGQHEPFPNISHVTNQPAEQIPQQALRLPKLRHEDSKGGELLSEKIQVQNPPNRQQALAQNHHGVLAQNRYEHVPQSRPEQLAPNIQNRPEQIAQNFQNLPEQLTKNLQNLQIAQNPQNSSEQLTQNPQNRLEQLTQNPQNRHEQFTRSPQNQPKQVAQNLQNPQNTREQLSQNPPNLPELFTENPQNRTAGFAQNPPNRPVYKRNDSYVTGEQLHPLPGPCLVNNSNGDENFVY